MKVAIIGGTGDQGFGLALRFARAGEKVLLGSRDIKKAENTVNILHNMLKGEALEPVQGMTNLLAAEKGDVVILTVPLQAQIATLNSIKDQLKDKIFVDASVPLDTCIGGSSTHYVELWENSVGERSAAILKDKTTKVVSAFNNISSSSLTNIKEKVNCDCLISGDDLESKKVVMELAEKIPGVRAFDCGPLANARIVEKITPLLITLNIKNKTRLAGLRITGI